MSGNETIVLGPGGSADPESERARDEIFAGLIDRLNAGEAIDAAEVHERWPGHAAAVLARLKEFEAFGTDGAEDPGGNGGAERTFGDYTIVRELGRGGMGVVYEAIERSMDRKVALKILPPGLLIDARSVTRFQREAKIAGKLRHQNIVAVYGTGVHEKTPYIAMEIVEGEGFEKVLARRREGAETQDLTSSIVTAGEFAGAAAGLQHAHSMGILHRDLKPSNLILDREGRLRILDFGLARIEGQESLTASREILGTPRYMSPEVARGGALPVDHRTDIFSLGASLYEALTLTPPFPGATVEEALSDILHHEPRPPRAINPRIPRDLETIILKCLEKAPADRYGTAEALEQDLRRFARGDPIEVRPQSAIEKVARRIRRNKGKLAAAATILALLVSAAWFARKSYLEEGKALLAQYDNTIAGAVARSQMGMFAGQASQIAWVGQGYDVTRLREGLGFEEFDAKLVREVMASLEKAIQSVPVRAEAHYQLARILVYQGNLDRAEDELRLAVDRGSTPAMVLLAKVLEERGRGQEAAGLKKCALESPEGLWAEALIAADRFTLEGKWKEAANAYQDAIDIGKRSALYAGASAEIYMSSGVARLLSGDNEGARSSFQTAAALRPGALEPELLVGIAYRSEDKAAEADQIFEKLHERGLAGDRASNATGSGDVASWLAMFYWSRFHDPERALKWAERIPPSFERELWRVTCLSTLRPGPEAVEAAQKLTQMKPEAALSYFIASTAYLGAGNAEKAAEMASKATERAPRSAMPRLILANALRLQGKFPESHAALVKATEVEPEAAIARYYLGLSLQGQGLLEEASRSFEKALENAQRQGATHFSLSDAHFRLGSIRQGLGRKDTALPAFRSAVEAARTEGSWNPQAHLALASLLFEKGERIEAIRVIEAALDSPVADDSVASRLPGRLEQYASAVVPELPTYRAVDIALRNQSRAEIIAAGARWRFHRGTVPPSPGLEWTRRDFDDSGWEEGPSGFGYGDDDDATVIDDMRGRFTTIYVRRKLAIPAEAQGSRMLLGVAADDGFIAYWDGTEIGRHHAPGGSPVPHDAKASEEAVEPLLPVEIVLAPGLLSGGSEHVLAIQGLNLSLESSDFSLIPVLRAERPDDAAGARRVLEAFQSAADPSRDAGRLAYLRGRVLEAEGTPDKAAAEFAIAAGLDPNRPEPAIALARRLRAMGRAREAQARLKPLLAEYSSRALWDLFLAVSFVDLGSSPGDLLNLLPPSPAKPRSMEIGQARQVARAEDIRWLLGVLSRHEPLRIRAGGGDWTSGAGVVWSQDRFYTAGQLFADSPGKFEGEIQGTDDDPIYQTERHFQAVATSLPGYSVPLPPGPHRVTLHFAEIYHRAPRERVFDVIAEGQPVLEDFEPGAAGFATAVKRTFEVEVKDGLLDIGFRARVGHPKVSAIEIEPIAP